MVLSDVYLGGGLRGVPRGTVKSLRVFSYNFSFRGMGGQIDRVGLDGPWDVRVILGTVPVEEDGSAHFKVPAMMPIAVQPLDDEGKAVQYHAQLVHLPTGRGAVLRRLPRGRHHHSPGRVFPAPRQRPPDAIRPWYGPMRGFSFRREVQPVLDRYCIGCHDGNTTHEGTLLADLTSRPDVQHAGRQRELQQGRPFPAVLLRTEAIRPRRDHRKRRPPAATVGVSRRLDPTHATPAGTDTTGVELDDEAYDRLITWIDMNTPAHGIWREIVGDRMEAPHQRRKELMKLHTGIDYDPEDLVALVPRPAPAPVVPAKPPRPATAAWAGFSPDEARRRQLAALPPGMNQPEMEIPLADGVTLRMMRIPVGSFGSGREVEQPFWIGATEITNRQYACFDPSHDSRLEHGEFLQFSIRERGYPAQRAGTTGAARLVARGHGVLRVAVGENRTPLHPAIRNRVGMGRPRRLQHAALVSAVSTMTSRPWPTSPTPPTRAATPSAWASPAAPSRHGGRPPPRQRLAPRLRSGRLLRREPLRPPRHGRQRRRVDPLPAAPGSASRRIVRGGSWQDTPKRARSSSRLAYRPDQSVIDVGFRVICE